MQRIGPTFGDELKAAGLAGLPMNWSWDGELFFTDAITVEQRQAVLAVLAQHDPTKRPQREVWLAQLDTATNLSQVKTVLKQLLGA